MNALSRLPRAWIWISLAIVIAVAGLDGSPATR
jgi:hypothetical protein